MPNIRKKLIELQDESDICPEGITSCIGCKYHKEYAFGNPCDVRAAIADKMIAQGVTVQKWIPVTERLPDVEDSCLVVVKYKYDYEKEYTIDTDVATFRFDGGYIDNCWDTYIDWDEGQQYLHITHWMPLPEPPKGESQ